MAADAPGTVTQAAAATNPCDIDLLAINTIRTLTIDAVEKKFGFTVGHVYEAARRQLAARGARGEAQ